ncbi:MAG: class I SAM-dependent methyltransferase [Maricaulaceae bacterium]
MSPPKPLIDPQTVPGFLDADEGAALAQAAEIGAQRGDLAEIGAYCGRSTLYLGAVAQHAGRRVLSVDHHRGSEEHQPGEAFYDPALWDADARAVDSLAVFRRTLRRAGLEETVFALVGQSEAAAAMIAPQLGCLFLDGGHSLAQALADYRAWAGKLVSGGILAIHDVFADPAQGGRPPYEVATRAAASGLFAPWSQTGSLAVFVRL